MLILTPMIARVSHKRHKWLACRYRIQDIEETIRFVPSQWKKLLQSNAISHWLGANLVRADSRFTSGQRETSLHSNTVFHWLGANLASALNYEHSMDTPYYTRVSFLYVLEKFGHVMNRFDCIQITKTLRSTSIRYQSDTIASDRCLTDIDLKGPIPEKIRSLWKSDRITNFLSAHNFSIRSDSTNDPALIGSWSWAILLATRIGVGSEISSQQLVILSVISP